MAKSTRLQTNIYSTELSNGIRVLSERIDHSRSVALGIWVGSGSRRESEEQNGLSHFIEHMVFKGTANREAEQIARELDSIGGHMDAFTSRELVSYNAKVLDEHLPVAFDVLSDLVLNPLFREEDIKKEKSVILEEIKMDADNAEWQTHDLFCRNFWKGNALGRSILGTPKTVRSFDAGAIRKYFGRTYAAPNMVITAAGLVEHKKLVRMVEHAFGGLPKTKPLKPLPRARISPHITMKTKASLEQVNLCVGVPSYAMPHKLRFACYVLNLILGGGMSSRLFQNIRERQGLVYNIGSELQTYRDTGCLGVYAGTSPETLRKVVDSILLEFRRMKDEPVSSEELRRAKDNLKGSMVLGLESSSSRMSNLARQQIFFGCYSPVDVAMERVEAVTIEQVQQIANQFLQQDKISLTALGRLNGTRFRRRDLVC